MAVLQSPAPALKGKRQKGKISQVSGPSSPSPSPFNSTDSLNEPCSDSGAPFTETALPQLLTMQEMLEQVIASNFYVWLVLDGYILVSLVQLYSSTSVHLSFLWAVVEEFCQISLGFLCILEIWQFSLALQ
jgi:hypothetical protein